MFKSFEIPNGDKSIKFSCSVTKVDDDSVAFSLFNECGDKWEWALMKSNGMEHYMPDVAAVGLTFGKLSTKAMAQVLRFIADALEEYK